MSKELRPQASTKSGKKVSRKFTKPNWRTFRFGEEEYALAVADENGVLVFRDAIFEEPFDRKERNEDCTNVYNNSTLKRKLEEWFDKYAPQAFKDNYTIDLLEAYEIFDWDQLPQECRNGKQLAVFKDWHNRVKGMKGQRRGYWWWTKTKTSYYGNAGQPSR